MPVEYFDTTGPQNTGINLIGPVVFKEDNISSKEQEQILLTNTEATVVYRIALPIIFGLIIAIGIVGNILVIYVIATQRKLRTVINSLLLNLAVADILFLVICGPLIIIHYATGVWLIGETMCCVTQYFMYVTCCATIYTLVTVAVVRYILVVRSGSPACVTNITNILYIIVAIWAVCLLVNVPVPMAYELSSGDLSTDIVECIISSRVRGQLFYSLFFGFAYAIPLLVIGIVYFLLVRYLLAEQRSSMIRRKEDNRKSVGSKRKSSHVTRILILVVAVFAMCWLPLHVHLLWDYFGHIPKSFAYRMCMIVWYALIFLNSALNPIIYNFASSEFREAFRTLCDGRLRKEGSISSGSGSRGALIKSQTQISKIESQAKLCESKSISEL